MDRRRFAVGTLGGSVLAAFTAAIGRAQPAAADGPRQGPVGPQENILFSETDYGHWGDWVSLHVPQVKLDGGVLTVTTPHPQSDEHYIVSHAVVLAGGVFLSRETFSSSQQPVSQHPLPKGYAGGVTVISNCNRHDTWVKTLVV
jgi:superoxide reductase